MPWRCPTSSISPTAAATAARGSCSSPKVSARKKNSSESVAPSISGNSAGLDGEGQVALHGREIREEPVVHPQPAVVAERMAVGLLDCRAGRGTNVREDAAGRRLGGQLRGGCGRSRPAPCCGTPRGYGADPYQPTPKPSPLVVVTPRRECLLWITSELSGLYKSSSRFTGEPEYASQRHMMSSSFWTAVHHACGERTSSPGGDSRSH